MKVIAVLGDSSSGKSLTLKFLIKYVVEALFVLDVSGAFFLPLIPQHAKRCTTFIDAAKWGDFLARLRIEETSKSVTVADVFVKLNWNGKTVGIFSVGDTKEALKAKMDQLAQCDVIVCPTHNKPEMIALLSHNASEGLLLFEKEKVSKSSEWMACINQNKLVAKKLFHVLMHEMCR